MKRCIATLDVGGGSLHPASRASLEAAASRWDADLVIFTEPLAKCHIWWQKTFAIDHLLQYDHVLQIDADVLIAEDCPSPFPECDPARLGVCRDLQHPSQYRLAGWLSNQTRRWSRYLGLRQPGGRQCVNAGLLLYGPRHLLPWFRLWRAIGRTHNFPGWGLGDQSVLCVLCVNFQFHQLLPDRWNHTHANTHLRPDLPKTMSGSIYHFCGRADRAARVESTNWRVAKSAQQILHQLQILRR
jgi:hypothetical protein